MDKKSFLRGFGTGVLFVAVILGISCLIRTSDSAVISRARKLGMTFSTSGNKSVLDTKAPATGSSVSGGNDSKSSSEDADKQDNNIKNTPKASSKASKKSSDTDKFKSEKKKLEQDMENEKKNLTINSGDWAKKVADKLEKEGVIDDSDKFVDYMKDNDYAGKIRAGEYQFEEDEDFSEIAKMITKQKKSGSKK